MAMNPSQATFLPEIAIKVLRESGNLAVFRYGAKDGKPILALHGITSSNRLWQCFARTVTAQGYTVYAVDLRGRGQSNKLSGPFGMLTHAQDMVAVLDHLEIKKADLIGHSMGAFIVAAMASVAPTRINRAVFIDGGIPLPLPHGYTPELVLPLILGPALTRLAMTFESKEAYRNYWKPQQAFTKGWSAVMDEYVDYDLEGEAPYLKPTTNVLAVEEDSADLFGSELIEDGLRGATEEILFLRAVRGLQNEEVPLYPEEIIHSVLTKYPKIKLVTVPDVNHYDILLEQSGANLCAEIIYGAKT